MKTRIIYTKFWKDEYIGGLNLSEKVLFLYLLTNEHVGLSDIYELSDRIILFDTGLNKEQLENAKQKFEKDGKFRFVKGYIRICNGERYNRYLGDRNAVAMEKERNLIPKGILDTLSIPYQYPTDSLITIINNHNNNHNPNKKQEIRNREYIVKNREDLIKELKVKYADKDVEKAIDNFIGRTGAKDYKYKDYYLALCNWIREDKFKEFTLKEWRVGV